MSDIIEFLAEVSTRPDDLALFWQRPQELLDRYGFTAAEQELIVAYDGTTFEDSGWNDHDEVSEPIADRAMELHSAGRHEDALSFIDAAIQADDRLEGRLPIERGLVLMALERYEEALACFREAGEANHDLTVSYNIAVAAVRAHGTLDAQAELEDLRKSVVRHVLTSSYVAKGLYGLAGLHALEGATPQAAKYLRKAIVFEAEIREWALSDPSWKPYLDQPWFIDAVAP